MSSVVVNLHEVRATDASRVSVVEKSGGAVLKVGDPISGVGLFAAGRNANECLGELIQIGERIAQEARAAGHRYRTEKRTAALNAALEAVGA